ncbi:MAG: tetratricopeptide repeat protein [Hormoscilla sp. GM102CHS1]|nr:tetratricopeptide repeat protein [Hormoscilla sp. GM102CHS1]
MKKNLTVEKANEKFAQGKFQEAVELYRKAIAENPELLKYGLNINLAHSIILSADWNSVSRNLPRGINYLEYSGWLDFYGLIPSYTYKNCTSIFFGDEKFLKRGCLPSEKQSCLERRSSRSR